MKFKYLILMLIISFSVGYCEPLGLSSVCIYPISPAYSGNVGVYYQSSFASNCSDHQCSLSNVPPGLVAGDHYLSGTPTAAGSYSGTLTCTLTPNIETSSYTITISP